MDFIKEKEIIQEKLNTKLDFESWYYNENRVIVRSLTDTEVLTSNQIKELDYTDKKVDKFSIDGMTLYSFNYEINAHIILVFYGDIEMSKEQRIDLYVYIGSLYTNSVIVLAVEQRHIIFDIVRSMSQPLELEEILKNILKGAIIILDKVNMGYIQLYNE